MAYLTIKDSQYEAKTTFKFEKKANAKYSTKEEGTELNGFMSLYLNLLAGENNETLIQFWDCALAHYKDNQPSVEAIEEALEERVDELGEVEPLFQEAFLVLDKSGFFKKQANTFKKGLLTETKPQKNETQEQKKERETQNQATKMLIERYEELTGSKLSK